MHSINRKAKSSFNWLSISPEEGIAISTSASPGAKTEAHVGVI
jgi:hypothetical protein